MPKESVEDVIANITTQNPNLYDQLKTGGLSETEVQELAGDLSPLDASIIRTAAESTGTREQFARWINTYLVSSYGSKTIDETLY